jgi:hypothetical protein
MIQHAELGCGNCHRRSAQKAPAIGVDLVGHMDLPNRFLFNVAAYGIESAAMCGQCSPS